VRRYTTDETIELDARAGIVLTMIGNCYCKLTVDLHAKLPMKEMGDFKGSGTIEVINFPDVGFGEMDATLKGGVSLELGGGGGGDYRLEATVAVKSTKKIKMWGFLEIDIPLEFKLSVASIDGVIKIKFAMVFKERYEVAATLRSDGGFTLSLQAFDIGPLQFLTDLLSINPWAWYDDIAASGGDIVQGIGALKKLTTEFLRCEVRRCGLTREDNTLTTPGSKRLKLKCDKLLSSCAFNFNLRRYSEALTFSFDMSADGRGLHSYTFRLNLSTFCGVRCLAVWHQ